MNQLINQYNELMTNEQAEKIEYNISSNYVKNLDSVFGIKEFIANFYDVNKENFKMTYKNKGLVLEDENTGIDIRFMIIGNSGSREFSDKIGEHGEGFKIGALTLVRLGHKVLIETVGYTIAFGIETSSFLNNSEVMFAKYIKNQRKVGTKLFTQCTKQSFDKAKAMFLHLSDYTSLTKHIIDIPGKMKNIYLNGLSHTTKKALFGYNIFEKNLVSNRDRNFISLNVLKEQLVSIYEKLEDENAIKIIMDKMLEEKDSFNTLLESKIVDDLRLDKYQKEMFRKNLDPNHYYTPKGKPAVNVQKGKELIVVDDRLFAFLEMIGAKTIQDERVSTENDDNCYAYSFDATKLPPSFDVEGDTIRMLISWAKYEKDTFQFSFEKEHIGRFHFKQLNETFSTMKPSLKSNNHFNSRDFKPILNNLLLLSCYDFDITVTDDRNSFSFNKEIVNENISIQVFKEESENKHPGITITKKAKVPFINGKRSENKTYLYIGCLRFEKINGLFSYQISNVDRWVVYRTQEYAKSVIQKAMNQKPKDFATAYLMRLKENLYEHSFDFQFNEKTKKVFKKQYEEIYPNHVVKSEEVYDEVVVNDYGYKLLDVSSDTKSTLINELGIKQSSQIFMEKQEIDIHVIPPTDALKEAIRLFEEMVNESTQVELTPILPNHSESLNRSGVIYISAEGSQIPIYLAGLIAYEHSQMKKQLKKVSHDMQSHLSHYILTNN